MIGGGATYVTNSLEAGKRSLEKRSLEKRLAGAVTGAATGVARAAMRAAAETAPRVARVRGGGRLVAQVPSPVSRISQQARLPHTPIMSPPKLPSQPSTLTKLAQKARDGSTTALGTFAFAGLVWFSITSLNPTDTFFFLRQVLRVKESEGSWATRSRQIWMPLKKRKPA